MKRYQIATAAAFIVVAAVAMIDSRASALPDPTGTFPGGLGPGFYPFWASFVVAVASVVVAARARREVEPETAEGVFNGRAGVTAVLAIGVPMALIVVLLPYLGFYIVTALYMGGFARFIGRYRWYWALLIAVAFPLAIYLGFENGFRVSLPKSIFYTMGLPF